MLGSHFAVDLKRYSNTYIAGIFIIFILFVFVQFFSAVCFKMSPQIGCMRGCKIPLIAMFGCPPQGSFNVSSNELPGRMQSHTGNICLFFPHHEISNVSSNELPRWMQSHTGHICSFFSTVRYQMSPQMSGLRGCIITLTPFFRSTLSQWLHFCYFWLRVYSNGSSNWMSGRIYSHTGHI